MPGLLVEAEYEHMLGGFNSVDLVLAVPACTSRKDDCSGPTLAAESDRI